MNETQLQIVSRIEDSHRLAFRQPEAAEVMGISRASLHREIKRGKIHPTKTLRVITREELLRYLRNETPTKTVSVTGTESATVQFPQKRRVPRSQYKPVPFHA